MNSIVDGILDPNVLVALVLVLVFVYVIWTWDNKRQRNLGSNGTCPAGFGSTKENAEIKNDVNEEDSGVDNKSEQSSNIKQ